MRVINKGIVSVYWTRKTKKRKPRNVGYRNFVIVCNLSGIVGEYNWPR